MTDLIKPPHAISIWATKEILYVEFPKADGSPGQAHTVKYPLNVFGLTQLLNTLKARSENSRLATKGDPTTYQVEREIEQLQRKAAGYKGPITKEAKVPLSQELKSKVSDVIRRFITT